MTRLLVDNDCHQLSFERVYLDLNRKEELLLLYWDVKVEVETSFVTTIDHTIRTTIGCIDRNHHISDITKKVAKFLALKFSVFHLQ